MIGFLRCVISYNDFGISKCCLDIMNVLRCFFIFNIWGEKFSRIRMSCVVLEDWVIILYFGCNIFVVNRLL